jgi:hypothetical protein
MPKIMISYRRLDSDAIAGRIRDRLTNHYGEEAIFMDIDSIPLGIDFRQHVQNALSQSDLVIAVVGPKWLGARHRGRPRITEDTDPVRIEIETTLQRGVRLIPVLVNHATMPRPSDLPQSLEQFAYHNAAAIDAGRDFHQHMDRLIRSIDEILGTASRPSIAPAALSRKGLVIAASVAVCAILAGTLWLFRNEIGLMRQTQPPPSPPPDQSKPPAPNTTASNLSVLSAIYGDNCPFNPDDKGQVDVTSLMAEFCKKEPPGLCRYPIQQRALGDPSKGCAKSFRVRYACGGEKDAIIKEAFLPPEAAGNYALLACSGATGAIRSTLEDGVDRAGYDYRNFQLPNPETKPCQDACLDDARCRAWTFVRPGNQGPSSACWLKSDVPPPANRPCCVSGIIR